MPPVDNVPCSIDIKEFFLKKESQSKHDHTGVKDLPESVGTGCLHVLFSHTEKLIKNVDKVCKTENRERKH